MIWRTFACVVLTSTTSAFGAVVMFDNSNATFVWVANGDLPNPGAAFDPTLPPQGQSMFNAARSLSHGAGRGGSSSSVIADAFVSFGDSLRIARTTVPRVVNGPNAGQQTTFDRVAQIFQGGEVVGSAGLFDQAGVHVGAFNIGLGSIPFLGQHPFVGFRVILGDNQFHYGWIEFDRRSGPTAEVGGGSVLMYQPVRWAYETLPNTPITVVPSPGALGMLALGGMMAARRRRAC